MENAMLNEAQAEIKTSGRNINNLKYVDDTTLMEESKEKLKSLLMKVKEESSKASILQCSAFFTVQFSHPYTTTGKTIALTRRTFVGKVMSLLFNMLSRLVITFLPRSKHRLISWLQSPSAVILLLLNRFSRVHLCATP